MPTTPASTPTHRSHDEAMPVDDPIRVLVTRLSRPHGPGGAVIERAAILAEGAGSAAVFAWIAAHDGQPETQPPSSASRGLHGVGGGVVASTPRRYVLPPGALT